MISDLAMAELNDATPDTLHGLGLQVMALSGEDISQIIAMGSRYPALTVYDRAHLVLAERERAILLTGDRRLREAAEQNGITVHGTLWLLDKLIEAGLLTAADAAHALRQMLAKGSRLPANECQRRLKAWEKQP